MIEKTESVNAGATPPVEGATESAQDSSSEITSLRSLLQTTEAARDEAVGIAAGLRDALAGRVTPLERIGSATEETCTCRFHTARRELKALQARAEAAESRLSSLTQAHVRLIAKWREDSDSIFCTLLEGQVMRRLADDLARLGLAPDEKTDDAANTKVG